ncbi:hypothetical protein FVB9288_02014 [Flavobacterium sp. CECT 9288]|uniref:T9SS type B sorting domain-containing protein n=1 Tax=Flavobacterium sp. CECT 9288 TaxID=2845819 RepID=UPI001E53C450|nr:T9SS type B sorting domain-containing protein [Flavobacterium sp. CECT 9288]CAH0336327.1 hypothetical protein FVB9288_02014 [Flavobacterium sp. CECT 9288]
MKKTLLLLTILLSISCFAQFSKTHYIPPITAQSNVVEDHYIYISTPNTKDVPFKIIENGGNVITGVVNNVNPFRYFIGTGDFTQLFTPKNTIGILKNKGYVIEAEDLVYANIRVNAARTNSGAYNHAGGLVSKGNSALGKTFRLGAMLNPLFDTTLLNFASILATENGTKVTISNLPIGTVLTDGTVISGPITLTLNKNESYVLALENTNPGATPSNSAKMIGALVESDKAVAVNAGSFCGSNSSVVSGAGTPTGRDVGFDQIVPIERTGTEYIFAKGLGTDELERVLLVAHTDQTKVFLNGNTSPLTTLNKGEYVAIDGTNFTNGSLYVTSSEKVFAYQSIGGTASPANQNMFFVPPLNCSTPNVVDNIPNIQEIGSTFYDGGLNIITETGATVLINNSAISASPQSIIGNPGFVKYTVSGLNGNISVKSTKQVYVSYFATNGAATYGGYYSGFDIKPEIVSDKIAVGTSSCIPNVVLKISSLSAYDTFQWYKDDVAIPLATNNTYTPTTPGYYQVKGSISGCLSDVFSDKIPVSDCAKDNDNDGTNNNIDIDWDNDGILNCTESFGNKGIDISNTAAGVITQDTYSNSFTGTVSTSATSRPTPFTGNNDGVFSTDVAAGKENFVAYQMNFTKPITVQMSYVNTANSSDLLNADAEYIINSDVNKTITVLNPNDQLVIDTNYDGIYESGVTQFTSFEIRFRLNSAVPLAAGTGTFKFVSYLTSSLSIKHKNLSDTDLNKGTFKFEAVCIPRDYDGDGFPDQEDSDSDADGIFDTIEAQVNAAQILSNIDANKNGLDNAFEPGFTPQDSDSDSVPDYLDLDSDNDGIQDSVETGNDLDADGIKNYRDIDSDGDLCFDVVEAGFLDPNTDGILGNNPVTVDSKGKVTSAVGYTAPNSNYSTAAPIVITTQPNVLPTCELQNATVTLDDNGGNTYQWELSTDGINWNTITNNSTYSGTATKTLLISSVTKSMNGYQYRVILNKIGNSCGLISDKTNLTVYDLPTINNVTIVQCDNDLDAITTFNLTVKNNEISSNASAETFTYYTTLAAANTANAAQQITNPLAYTNATPGVTRVWTRVTNNNNCFRTAEITLQVLATQIPSTFNNVYTACDDLRDLNGLDNANNNKRDGISTFDFSATETAIKTLLPAGNYTVSFYRNQADALAETNKISDITNYRNIGYPGTQDIWGRVDSDVTNACFGLGPFVKLVVEQIPFANPVTIARQCDDNQDGIFTFETSTLHATVLNGQTNVNVTYFDENNNALSSPFPATFTTTTQNIKAVVTNNSTLACSEEVTIAFIVDDLPEAFSIPTNLTTVCDDEVDPLLQDGKYSFDTTTFQNSILGGQTGMKVNYFDKDGKPLTSPLPNPFVTLTQNITVEVENTINPTCKAILTIPFIVNPLPPIQLNTNGGDNELVCSNLPTFFVQLNAGLPNGTNPADYSYTWYKDSNIITNETGPTLDVNAEGDYSVEVATLLGCERTRTIKVTASDIATIASVDIVDLAENNTVTVDANGKGDYEYSLDLPNGPFQDSNLFDNVPSGIHEVYINDKNGCGTVSKTIAVTGAPKFFTPNGDRINDFWNIKGINNTFNKNAVIYIFNRFGKLIKQITASSQGWDGTFTGQPMPADDYWFTVKLDDGREMKGHFSLKR